MAGREDRGGKGNGAGRGVFGDPLSSFPRASRKEFCIVHFFLKILSPESVSISQSYSYFQATLES